MTVLTVGVAVTVITCGAAAPAVAGASSGVVATVAGGTASATVAGSAGAGAVVGTIAGAAAGGTAASAATGAAVGASAAAAVTSSSAGTAGITAGLAAGPIGWLVLGAVNGHKATYDCWKPILHDSSIEPSRGILLRDLLGDSRVQQVIVDETSRELPAITLINVWGEKFQLEFFKLPSNNQLVAHAIPIA